MKFFLLYFFAWFLFIPMNAFAIQKAVIKVNRAIVYSDIELKTPIGYLNKGQVVNVGSNPKFNGSILPTIISGKVVYLKVKDLKLSSDNSLQNDELKRFTDYNIEQLKIKEEDNFLKNNFFLIEIGSFSMGENWNLLADTLGDELNKSAFNIKLLFEHRPVSTRLSFGFGFGYYTLTQEKFLFKSLTIEANLNVAIIRTKYFNFLVNAGPILSAASVIEIKGADVPFRGSLYGYKFGARADLFPTSKWGIYGGLAYQKMNFTKFDTLIIPDTLEDFEIDNLSGTNMMIGLTYQY